MLGSAGESSPEPIIRRRFVAGLRNFKEIHMPIVDEWALYDNSVKAPQLIEEGVNDL